MTGLDPVRAAVAIDALLDLYGDKVTEPVLGFLMGDQVYGIDAIADLYECLDEAGRAALMIRFGLCPVHQCDAEICADDENPECAHLRTGQEDE